VSQDLFSNIEIVDDSMGVASGGPIIANTSSDTLTLDAGTGIEIAGDALNDTVAILLNADLDNLNDVNDPPGFASPGDALVWDGYVWGPDTVAASAESAKFVSQWTSASDWVQRVGDPDFSSVTSTTSGDYRHRFSPYVFISLGGLSNTTKVLRDNTELISDVKTPIFDLNTAIPLSGDLSGGVGASIDGSHQGSLPGYEDPVSGFPADPPTSCRVTCYFLMLDGLQGLPVGFDVDLLAKKVGALDGPMAEFSDGDLVWSGVGSGIHSSGTIMKNSHYYPFGVNGTLIVSDFSPLKIDTAMISGGICELSVIINNVINGYTTPTGGGLAQLIPPVSKSLGLVGARLLWTWEGSNSASNSPVNNAPVSNIQATSAPSGAPVQEGSVVNAGTVVTVDAFQSFDIDGDSLSYSWELYYNSVLQVDPGNVASLVIDTNTLGGVPIEARLTVSDGLLDSSESVFQISVAVPNQAPAVLIDSVTGVLEVGPNQSIAIAATASDSDGVIAVYAWTVVSQPNGSTAGFSSTTTEDTSFLTDTAGSYTVRLTVTDDDGATAFDEETFSVAAQNVIPTADISGPLTGQTGGMVILSGVNSFDPDGSIVVYDWNITQQPINSVPTFTIVNGGVDRKFIPDLAGTYRITLRVKDNSGAWSPDVFIDFVAT
jgi:hypothetical protein